MTLPRSTGLLIALVLATGPVLRSPVARAGQLLVVSFQTDSVLRYDGSTGVFIDALVPSGSGGLHWPEGLAVSSNGDLYVASSATDSVLRYDGATGTFRGAFVPSGSGGLHGPLGLAFGADGNLYVDGFFSDGVLRYDGGTGAFLDAFVPSGSGGLDGPEGLPVFGPDGRLYVISGLGGAVLRYDGVTGAFIDTFIASGSGGLTAPQDLVFGPDDNLYVADGLHVGGVRRYDGLTGTFIDAFVAPGAGGLSGAEALTFGPDGNLYVTSGNAVLRYDGRTGAFIDVFVSPGSGGLSGALFLRFVDGGATMTTTTTTGPNPTTTLILHAGSVADPEGDATAGGPDIESFSLCYTATELQASVNLFTPWGDQTAVVLELDVDRNPDTGLPGIGGQGFDFLVSAIGQQREVVAFDLSTNQATGTGTATYGPNSVVMRLPLAAIAADGGVDAVALAGTLGGNNIPISDQAPDIGVLTSVPCGSAVSTTTAPSVASTTTLPGTGCTSDGECDDGNPCTLDECARGQCVNPPLTGGAGAECEVSEAGRSICSAKLKRTVDRQLARVDTAIGRIVRTATPRRKAREKATAERAVHAILKRTARFAAQGKIAPTCARLIRDSMQHLLQTIATL